MHIFPNLPCAFLRKIVFLFLILIRKGFVFIYIYIYIYNFFAHCTCQRLLLLITIHINIKIKTNNDGNHDGDTSCKDWFQLEPKIEMDSGPKTRTINLQRVGEKASLNLGKRYWKIVLKGKSYTCTNTKGILGHALVV